jgi:hypothetical protein
MMLQSQTFYLTVETLNGIALTVETLNGIAPGFLYGVIFFYTKVLTVSFLYFEFNRYMIFLEILHSFK